MTENEIETLHIPFKNYLRYLGLKFININPKNKAKQSSDGLPDFIIFTEYGMTVCIEFKTPEKMKTKNNGLRPKQIEWKNYLETYRHHYLLTDDFKHAVEFLKKFL